LQLQAINISDPTSIRFYDPLLISPAPQLTRKTAYYCWIISLHCIIMLLTIKKL